MTDADRENYYSTGNEFSYCGGVWVLDSVREDGQLVLYSSHDERYEIVSPEDVIRIL